LLTAAFFRAALGLVSQGAEGGEEGDVAILGVTAAPNRHVSHTQRIVVFLLQPLVIAGQCLMFK
jgi:hypothetical protein